MTSERPVRLALAGYGRIARAHEEALSGRADARLAAVVETDAVRAAEARSKDHAVFPSIEAMLEENGIDAVIVCTPPDGHARQVRAVLEGGRHALVEKPLALLASEAADLVALARSAGLVLQTASKFPEMEAMGRVRASVQAGDIGELRAIHNVFSGVLDVRADWRACPGVSGGGVLMDNGPHSADVIRAIGGDVARVRVHRVAYEQATPVEDEAEMELQCASGHEATVLLSWNRAIAAPIARVIGSGGTLLVGWKSLELHRDGQTEVLAGGYDKNAAFQGIHARFLQAVRASGPACDGGARSLAVVEAAYRSIESRQWEAVAS